jgi:hypothetical protein
VASGEEVLLPREERGVCGRSKKLKDLEIKTRPPMSDKVDEAVLAGCPRVAGQPCVASSHPRRGSIGKTTSLFLR